MDFPNFNTTYLGENVYPHFKNILAKSKSK